MNRDDVIRMAREAATDDGSVNRNDGKNVVIYAAKTNLFLERFAALVAAAERARLAQPEPKPNGYLWFTRHMEQRFTHRKPKEDERIGDVKPLYTAPPQRKEEPEPVAKMREMLEVQGQNGTWNYDPYFHGMYNGMEFMLAMVENREPVFRKAPEKWLYAPPQREWVGLTDEEIREFELWLDDEEEKHGWNPPADIVKYLEAKLKEKNTPKENNT